MKLLDWFNRWKVKFHKWLIKMSWKKLPKEFDVFSFSSIDTHGMKDIYIPGTLYVVGSINALDIFVGGDLIVYGDVDCCDLTVGGSCFVFGNIDCFTVKVDNLFTCYDVSSNGDPIYATDYDCEEYEA